MNYRDCTTETQKSICEMAKNGKQEADDAEIKLDLDLSSKY